MSEENQVVNASHPAKLLEIAVSNNVDLDKLEKVMELYDRWERMEAEKMFNSAMSKWQSKKPLIKKTSKVDYPLKTGGRIKYNFADLSSIQRECDPILSDCGLSYNWFQKQEGNLVTITCRLSHESGHYIETTMSAPQDDSGRKNQIQQIGSTVSYLQRYTLQSIIGLSTDNDTDGNKPEDKKTNGKPELVPTMSEIWDNAVTALKKGSATIEQIETKYKLSDDNRDKLLDQAV